MMKRVIVLAALVMLAGLFGVRCSTPESAGGSLFSAGPTVTSFPTWDMVFMLTSSTVCAQSFAERGAGLALPAMPVAMAGGISPDAAPAQLGLPVAGGIFPGVKVKYTGYEYDADIPEVSILAYYYAGPPVVPGDTVVVHFSYQADADGEHGDYFLVRISDGDVFRVPVEIRGSALAAATTRTVNYKYTAQADTLSIQFITGLSDASDAVYLDDVQVRVAGVEVAADDFESAPYQEDLTLIGSAYRLSLRPGYRTVTALEETLSLQITGGHYFQLYGQGASAGGVTAAVLMYTDPDLQHLFQGESSAVFQGGIFLGNYKAYDDVVNTACAEEGQLVVAPNNKGNADISGVWYLTLDATCDEAGDSVHAAIGNPLPPHAAGDPVSMANVFGAFAGYPFSLNGDVMTNIFGLTLGKAGLVSMSSGVGPVQLVGAYDKASGVFAGQILGVLPLSGGGTCTVSSGTFVAVIDSTVLVPLPM
jgi:hypothetical protein